MTDFVKLARNTFPGLGTRARHSLMAYDYDTREKVVAATDRELLDLPNFGKLTLKEVRGWTGQWQGGAPVRVTKSDALVALDAGDLATVRRYILKL